MGRVSIFKGVGYLTSTLSVMLLGIVSWKSASSNPWMLACLLLGMATSIMGMCERWISHRLEQREKAEQERRSQPPAMPRSQLRGAELSRPWKEAGQART